MATVAGMMRRRWTSQRALACVPRSNSPGSFFSVSTTGTGDDAVPDQSGSAVGTGGSSPPPIRVSLTEDAGRGVFASRPIAAGDLIHTASPVVAHPSPSLLRKVCYYCLRRVSGAINPVLSDSSSKMRCFCSDECRKKSEGFLEGENKMSWSAFDTHCIERGLKYPFLVKRLACMVVAGMVSPSTLDILQPTNLYPEMISEMEEEYELLKQAFLKADIEASLITLVPWSVGTDPHQRI